MNSQFQLFELYNKELKYIRDLVGEFAQQYPGVATNLLLLQNNQISSDPHVERMIEAMALLAARVQLKLEDDFPELTDAMFSILYPHYLNPIPAMTNVQFVLLPGLNMMDGIEIPQHSPVDAGPSSNPRQLTFRTGYPVTLWPLAVQNARLQGAPFRDYQGRDIEPPRGTDSLLRITLDCLDGLDFSKINLNKLRFFMNGLPNLTARLYEIIFNNVVEVWFHTRPNDEIADSQPIWIRYNKPHEAIHPVGFEIDDGLLPYPTQAFLGYRLLSEFFSYPSKFLYFDLSGFDMVRLNQCGARVDVYFWLRSRNANLEQAISKDTFRLGCAPVVNLFQHTATPIRLQHRKYEYQVKPLNENADDVEVYSITAVGQTDATTNISTEYKPFYSYRHFDAGNSRAFWYAVRRPSGRPGDRGTDTWIRLVDLDFHPHLPNVKLDLDVRLLCLNRDLPTQLRQQFGEGIQFTLRDYAPIQKTVSLGTPTPTIRPPLRKASFWRLISHLTLNHLSITHGDNAPDTLREYLRLYDFTGSDSQQASISQQIIDGILSVKSRKVINHIGQALESERGDSEGSEMTGSGYARGIEITLELDPSKYVNVSAYLFACIMERFFAMYASINSFTQLVVRMRGQDESSLMKKWPPRSGQRVLL